MYIRQLPVSGFERLLVGKPTFYYFSIYRYYIYVSLNYRMDIEWLLNQINYSHSDKSKYFITLIIDISLIAITNITQFCQKCNIFKSNYVRMAAMYFIVCIGHSKQLCNNSRFLLCHSHMGTAINTILSLSNKTDL